MPKLHDRVLLTLSFLGFAGVFLNFLNFAPNRLANGIAYALFQAPLFEVSAAMTGLCALVLVSFVQDSKLKFVAAILAAGLVLWGSLSGAGRFAAILVQASPPAARVSLGPAFWILVSAAILAIVNALQKIHAGTMAGAGIGMVFCLGFLLMGAAGMFDHLSLAREFAHIRTAFMTQFWRHLALVGISTLMALLMGVPLTLLVVQRKAMAGFIYAVLGLLQTIPSIALFGVLITPLTKLSEALPVLRGLGINGTGPAPAILALTLYALLPLVRSFHTGLSEVASDVKDAATAIGFDARQKFIEVEFPLALPALLSGLRTVTIQSIGLASVAALIGAGGLGLFIFQGIGQYALDLVLAGALPVILLALSAHLIFEALIRLARRKL